MRSKPVGPPVFSVPRRPRALDRQRLQQRQHHEHVVRPLGAVLGEAAHDEIVELPGMPGTSSDGRRAGVCRIVIGEIVLAPAFEEIPAGEQEESDGAYRIDVGARVGVARDCACARAPCRAACRRASGTG